MPANLRRSEPLVVVLVVGVAVTLAVVSLFQEPSPASPAVTSIVSSHWSDQWAPGSSNMTEPFGWLTGSCFNLSGSYPIGLPINCWIRNNNPDRVGTGLAVLVTNLSVEPPFTLSFAPFQFCGMNCQVFGVTIHLPRLPGAYELNGTVEFWD